jgi:Tol biopolymer transport system component
MKMRKLFILYLLAIVVLCPEQSVKGFENELAIYSNPALSPDESQVVFECRDRNLGMEMQYDSLQGSDIFLVDVRGSSLRQLTIFTDAFWVSPDKSKVLLQTIYGSYLLDLVKRSIPRQVFNRFPEDILDDRYGSVEQISWSPSGKKFFFARAIGGNWERKYSIVDIETLEETVLGPELGYFPFPFQWIDDSTFFYEKDNEILTYNYSTKQGELLASGYPDERTTNPVLSPDMTKLLYQYTDQFKVRLGPPAYEGGRKNPQKIVVCQIKQLPDWAAEELSEKLFSGGAKSLKKIDYLLLDGSFSQVKVSWFRDSRRLMIKGVKELWLYDLLDSSYAPIFRDSMPITEAVLTHDQSKVFFISSLWSSEYEDSRITWKGNSSNLKVCDLKNKICRTIFGDSGPISQLRLSSDGSFLALVRGGNIWIVNMATEKEYQLTFDGGTKPQWLLDDKSILFVCNGSLAKVDLETKKIAYLTLGRGTEPIWISNKEVVVKSQGKFWQVSVDRMDVKELQKYPEKPRLTKGKRFEVYIDEIELVPRAPNLTQVKAQDLKTSQSWVIKQSWCNYPWALEEKNR